MTTPPPDQNQGSALAHLAVLAAAQRGQINGLDERVTEVEQALADAPSAKGAPAIRWAALSADEAAAVQADLAQWVGEVLFTVYPSARESVRECWQAHQDVVTEVSLIWLEYKRVFDPSRPPLADALVFHDRWLPGALKRAAAITVKCAGVGGCVLTPQPRRY